MAPLLTGVLSMLIQNNLPKVAQAVLDKGVEYVENKTGIVLKPDMQPEEVQRLREEATRHEEFKIEQDNKNVANARAMQVAALEQEDLFSKRFVMYFTSYWSFMSCLYVFLITFTAIPADNVRFADTILGFLLGTALAATFNFWLGSSSDSRRKTQLMATQQPGD